MHALHLLHAIRKFIHIERYTMNAIAPHMIISSRLTSSLLLDTLSPPKKGQVAGGRDFDAKAVDENRRLGNENLRFTEAERKGTAQHHDKQQEDMKYRWNNQYGKDGFRPLTA